MRFESRKSPFRFRRDFRQVASFLEEIKGKSWVRVNGGVFGENDSRNYVTEPYFAREAFKLVDLACKNQLPVWKIFDLKLGDVAIRAGEPCPKLRSEFKAQRLELTDSARVEPQGENEWRIRDGESVYELRLQASSTIQVLMSWDKTTLAALLDPECNTLTDEEASRLPVTSLQNSESEPAKLSRNLERYLRYMADTHASISLPFPTENGFAHLPINSLFCHPKINIRDSRSYKAEARPSEEQNLDIWEILKRYKRIVLLGDHGSGKSTLVAHIAFQIASADSKCPNGRIPFVVDFKTHPLKQIAAIHNLDDLILSVLALDAFRNTEDLCKEIVDCFEDGQGILLCDGLEELSPPERKHFIDFIAKLSRHLPAVQYLVLGRYSAERKLLALAPHLFHIGEILPPSPSEKTAYVDKFLSVYDANEQLAAMLHHALNDITVIDSSMFLLAFVSQFVASGIQVHEETVFRSILTNAIEKIPGPDDLKQIVTTSLALLAAKLEDDSLEELPQSDVVSTWADRDQNPIATDGIDWVSVLSDIVEKSGILTQRLRSDFPNKPYPAIRFQHPSFQAYFSSQARLGNTFNLNQTLLERLIDAARETGLPDHRSPINEKCFYVEQYYDPAFEEEFLDRTKQLNAEELFELVESMAKVQDATHRNANAILTLKCARATHELLDDNQKSTVFQSCLFGSTWSPNGMFFGAVTLFDRALLPFMRDESEPCFQQQLITEFKHQKGDRKEQLGGHLLQMPEEHNIEACLDNLEMFLVRLADETDEYRRVLMSATLYRASVYGSKVSQEKAHLIIRQLEPLIDSDAQLAWFWLRSIYKLLLRFDICSDGSVLAAAKAILHSTDHPWLIGTAAGILALKNRPTVYEQHDWTLELARIADGEQRRQDLPQVPTPTVVTEDKSRMCTLLNHQDLSRLQRQTIAMAMGRIGILESSMFIPLTQLITENLADRRIAHEASFYLGQICSKNLHLVDSAIDLAKNSEIALDVHFLLIWLDDYRLLERHLHNRPPGVSLENAMVALLVCSDPRGPNSVHRYLRSTDPNMVEAAEKAIGQVETKLTIRIQPWRSLFRNVMDRIFPL